MTKSTIVILNSNNLVTGNTQKAQYFVDWKATLDVTKKYSLHWTYLGGNNTYTGNRLPCVYLDINMRNYQTAPAGQTILSGASTTQMIGFLKPIILVGSSNSVYFQAEDNTNLPIYLESPPGNNIFNVSILDNSGNPYLDNAATPAVPASYVLLLKFTEVD